MPRALLALACFAGAACAIRIPSRSSAQSARQSQPLSASAGAGRGEALIFRDELLGKGTYGLVVEAICTPTAPKGYLAVEACHGPASFLPERWACAAAKCAAGPDPRALEYLAVEAHMSTRLAKAYPPGHPSAAYFLRYYGEATSAGAMTSDVGRKWLLWERATGVETEHRKDRGRRYMTLEDVMRAKGGAGECLVRLGVAGNPADAMRAVALQLFTALAAVHKLRIVHRDVKPENVMLVRTADGANCQLKLVDFGSAADMTFLRRVGYSPKLSPVTPKYTAPERFLKESKPFGFDSYSAGLVLLRLLFPGLAHDFRYDAFLDDFEACGHDFDSWTSMKLSDPLAFADEEVEVGLAYFNRDALGVQGWNFMKRILQPDPDRRPSAEDLLSMPFLNSISMADLQKAPPQPRSSRIFGL